MILSDKAVAVGAVSFYINRFVKGRLSRFTYGTPCSTFYRPSNPEHAKREHKTYLNVLGDKYVPDAFMSMLSKVCRRIILMRSTLLKGTLCKRRAPRFSKTEKSGQR
jgi:hypothetical protein